MRIVMDAEDAHLVVFEFDFVMLRIHHRRIEFGNWRWTRRLALQVDLQNPNGVIADVFSDISAACGTPADLAAMKFDVLNLVIAVLSRHYAGVEINQHAIGIAAGSRWNGGVGS